MRRYLIFASAIFGLLGVAADQLAFRADERISNLQQEREELIEWNATCASNLVELNNFRQRLDYTIKMEGRFGKDYLTTLKYDSIWFTEYVLEDESWIQNDEYSDLIFIDPGALERDLADLAEIFDISPIDGSEAPQIYELTAELHKGLILEIVNLDLAIYWTMENQLDVELQRQIFLLIAIVASLLSVLSVLIFARMYVPLFSARKEAKN